MINLKCEIRPTMIRKIVCSIAVLLAPMSLFGYNNYISGDPFLHFFGTVQFHYERAILKRMSAEIGFGRKFNSGIFELSGINTGEIFLNDLNFSGIKILPEIRYYLTKQDKGLYGLYAGIYYKYQTNFTHLSGTFTDKNNYTTDINLDMKIISNTYGIEIGYKLKIYKFIFCDMNIAGLGMSKHHLTLSEAATLSDKFYDDLDLAAEYYSPLKDFNPDIYLSPKEKSIDFTTLHFRYGFKLGISF